MFRTSDCHRLSTAGFAALPPGDATTTVSLRLVGRCELVASNLLIVYSRRLVIEEAHLRSTNVPEKRDTNVNGAPCS